MTCPASRSATCLLSWGDPLPPATASSSASTPPGRQVVPRGRRVDLPGGAGLRGDPAGYLPQGDSIGAEFQLSDRLPYMTDLEPNDKARIFLTDLDRFLPGCIEGFYIVGSSALHAFHAGRSDVDFVAIAGRDLSNRELRRLRLAHSLRYGRTVLRTSTRGQSLLSGSCNGVYVRAADMRRPVTAISAIGSQVGPTFRVGKGFDVNPVTWKVLLEHGIALRGPSPGALGLDPEPFLLRSWNLENLEFYWRPWALNVLKGTDLMFQLRPRWSTAWGVLGAPRLHYTIATGNIVTKEAAGQYAIDAFGSQWKPIIRDALAWRQRNAKDAGSTRIRHRPQKVAEFVLEVARSARYL